MHPTKLQGIIPPMITPLKGDDELDREGAVRLTEHLVAGGAHAIFLLGTTGEAQSLTYRPVSYTHLASILSRLLRSKWMLPTTL